jgi:hypothetical protein
MIDRNLPIFIAFLPLGFALAFGPAVVLFGGILGIAIVLPIAALCVICSLFGSGRTPPRPKPPPPGDELADRKWRAEMDAWWNYHRAPIVFHRLHRPAPSIAPPLETQAEANERFFRLCNAQHARGRWTP